MTDATIKCRPAKVGCATCGKVFQVQDDIRLVNAERHSQLPEPDHCSACLQVSRPQTHYEKVTAMLDRLEAKQ